MRNKYHVLVSALLCSFIYSTTSFATGPRVAPSLFVSNENQLYTLDLPPFISTKSEGHGLLFEIINTVLEAKKIAGNINILPSKNMAKYYFSQENALAIIGYNFNLNKEAQKHAIVVPILSIDEYYFFYQSPNEQSIQWNGELSSLKNKVYGTDKGGGVKKYQTVGIDVKYGRLYALLNKMQKNKVDFIKVPQLTMNIILEQNFPNEKHLFTKVQPKAGEINLGVIFNKRHPDGKISAEKFKVGLSEIIANGQFKAILQKHLGSDVMVEPYLRYLNVK